MNAYSLTNSISYQKISLLKLPRITLRIFLTLAALSIVIFSIFYIFQVNTEMREKYLFQQYENKLIQFSKENQILTINSVQTDSLNNIVGLLEEPVRSDGRNFEKVDKIHYIRILDTQFVAK